MVVMVILMVVVIEGWFNFGMRKGINFNFICSQIVDYHNFDTLHLQVAYLNECQFNL